MGSGWMCDVRMAVLCCADAVLGCVRGASIWTWTRERARREQEANVHRKYTSFIF